MSTPEDRQPTDQHYLCCRPRLVNLIIAFAIQKQVMAKLMENNLLFHILPLSIKTLCLLPTPCIFII